MVFLLNKKKEKEKKNEGIKWKENRAKGQN